MSPEHETVALRRLREADLGFAAELNALVGWNQTAADWRGYLQFEPEGCFVAEVGGRPAGTATTVAYGRRCGWIGMVLVHPDFRRHGLGTRLLRHSIEYLQGRGVGSIKLDATPMGRKVYVPLGFGDEYEISRYEGVAIAPGGEAGGGPVEPFAAVPLAEVAAWDGDIFGAGREEVLRSMAARKPEWCFVVRDRRGVRGYAIARQGRQAVQLGPWLAEDPATAELLLLAVWRRIAGQRVFVDVPHPNDAGRRLVEQLGCTVQRGFTRMFLGHNDHPGRPSAVFGTSGAEKG